MMVRLNTRVYGSRKPPFHRTWQSRSSSPEEDTRVKVQKKNPKQPTKIPCSQPASGQAQVQAQVSPLTNMGQEYSYYMKENQSADGGNQPMLVEDRDSEVGSAASTKGQDHIIDLESDEEAEDAQITPRASFLLPNKPYANPIKQSSDALPEDSASGFFALSEKDRRAILELVLRQETPFYPFYNAYNLELCDYDIELLDINNNPVLVNKMEVTNIDVPLLKVNKQMYREASAIFYGVNTFTLTDPEVGSWWLRRIGTNIAKIRIICLALKGFEHGAFRIREEKLWLNFLAHFLPKQNLNKIIVDFSGWEPIDFSKKWDYNRVCLWRKKFVDTLAKFQGLEKVKIIKGEFIAGYEAQRLKHYMMQGKDSVAFPFNFQISDNAVQVNRRIRSFQLQQLDDLFNYL